MKKNKSEGITLIALVITIVILLILASIGTYSGMQAIETARLNRFIAEMKIMQTQVNDIYDKYKNNDTVLGYTGEDILNKIGQDLSSSNNADKVFSAEASGITNKDGYRYFDTETIKSLGIEDITNEFFVNIKERNIISCTGLTYNDKTYYTLEQLPNSLYNVEYKESRDNPTFDVKCDLIGENKYKITIEPIYSGNIEKWKVKYQLDGDDYWNTSDELSFNIEKPGNYNIKIQNGEIESEQKTQYLGYISEGMVLYYDGIINTRKGHNIETTNWEDLSGNDNDGQIQNQYTWNEKSINLDNNTSGITGNYTDNLKLTDFTIEIMLESYTANSSGAVLYDFHTSGNEGYFAKIYDDSLIIAFGNTRYTYKFDFINSNYPIAIAIRCNKSNGKFDIYINNENVYNYTGSMDINKSNNYLFGILNDSECNEGVYRGKVNSFKIYNRILTDIELKQNYEMDKKRFNIL